MKKVALSLLTFALAGALAFADDMAPVAKINGYVNDGLKIVSNSNGVTYAARANDFGAAGYVGKLTGSLSAANYGVTGTIDLKQVGGVTVDGTYGWVMPIAGLKLEAGSGNSNPLGELDDNGAGAFSTAGLTVDYTTGGFTVGAVVSPDTAVNGAANGAALTFGARYAMDKMFTLNATAGTTGKSVQKTLDWYIVTFSLAAVDKLTLTGGYNVPELNTPALGASFFDATVAYKISDALSAGVVVYDKNISAGTSYFTYKPNASYSLGNGLTASAYLLGETQTNPNYEVQAELDYSLGGGTIKTQVMYDTNPGELPSAVPATTFETDWIYSF